MYVLGETQFNPPQVRTRAAHSRSRKWPVWPEPGGWGVVVNGRTSQDLKAKVGK